MEVQMGRYENMYIVIEERELLNGYATRLI
jgi:hypothetical protein